MEENNRIVVALLVVEKHDRNVVVVMLVVAEENYRILWPSKLYQYATFSHFLGLYSAHEELT